MSTSAKHGLNWWNTGSQERVDAGIKPIDEYQSYQPLRLDLVFRNPNHEIDPQLIKNDTSKSSQHTRGNAIRSDLRSPPCHSCCRHEPFSWVYALLWPWRLASARRYGWRGRSWEETELWIWIWSMFHRWIAVLFSQTTANHYVCHLWAHLVDISSLFFKDNVHDVFV